MVYLVEDTATPERHERVVKVIRPELLAQEEVLHRFIKEVKVTATLSQDNPHIVRVFGDASYEPKVGYFYVMEFLDGMELAACLKEGPALSDEFLFGVFRQICEAVTFAHRRSIIHRDLKPANVFLLKASGGALPFVKVLDFGVAKTLGETQVSLLKTKGAIGTPLYMPPEQFLNDVIDERSDVFALGGILWEMFTGKPLYADWRGGAMELMMMRVSQPPPSIRSSLPERASALAIDGILARALTPDPSQRFHCVPAFWNAIDEVLFGGASAIPLSAAHGEGVPTVDDAEFSITEDLLDRSIPLGARLPFDILDVAGLPTGDLTERLPGLPDESPRPAQSSQPQVSPSKPLRPSGRSRAKASKQAPVAAPPQLTFGTILALVLAIFALGTIAYLLLSLSNPVPRTRTRVAGVTPNQRLPHKPRLARTLPERPTPPQKRTPALRRKKPKKATTQTPRTPVRRTSCDRHIYRFGFHRRGFCRIKGLRHAPRIAWKLRLYGRIKLAPLYYKGLVWFFVSDTGTYNRATVLAFRPASHRPVHRFEVPDIMATPLFHKDLLIIPVANGLCFYDVAAPKPKLLHRYRSANAARCSPVVVGDVLYFCHSNHFIVSYSLSKRRVLRQHRSPSPSTLSNSLALHRSRLILGTDGGSLYVLSALTGKNWWVDIGHHSGAIEGVPVALGRSLYFASRGGKLFHSHPRRSRRWNKAVSGPASGSIAVDDTRVYVTTEFGEVSAFHRITGERVWAFRKGNDPIHTSPTSVDGVVYVGTEIGRVYVFESRTGKRLGSITLGRGIISGEILPVGGRLFVGTRSGWIFSLY